MTLDYSDGDLIKWGTLCDQCMDNIHAGDRAFLSSDGLQTLCYECAVEEERNDVG